MWKYDFRGKTRIVARLPVHGSAIFDLPWATMELDLDDRIQRRMAFGAHERREVSIVSQLVQPGATVVDVGAHVGYFTLLMADAVGHAGRVLSIEPDQGNYDRLIANVQRNQLTWVDTVNAAASDVDGSARLFPPGKRGESGLGTLIPSPHSAGIEVACRRLDTLLEERDVEKVDFIKIDVEGWEPSVLRGLEPLLEREGGPSMLVETNDRLLSSMGYTTTDLCEYLERFGYHRQTIPGRGGSIRPNSLFLREAHLPAARGIPTLMRTGPRD